MKKILIILMSVLIIISMSACSRNKEEVIQENPYNYMIKLCNKNNEEILMIIENPEIINEKYSHVVISHSVMDDDTYYVYYLDDNYDIWRLSVWQK